jgi:hypothetical protein
MNYFETVKKENIGKRYKFDDREFTVKTGMEEGYIHLVADDTREGIEKIYTFFSILYGEYEEI